MWRNLVARRLWEPKVTGSNPVIPICPCSPIGRGASLRTKRILVQAQSGVLVMTRFWSNSGSKTAHNLNISRCNSSSNATKVSAGVAQSGRAIADVCDWLLVQFLSPAPESRINACAYAKFV